MNIIDFIVHKKSNIEDVTSIAIGEFRKNVSQKQILKKLREHPDYGTFLSVADTLLELDIKTEALYCIDIEQISLFGGHLIVQIKNQDKEFFGYIFTIQDNYVDWYSPINHRRERITASEFKSLYTGYLLAIESKSGSGVYNAKYNEKDSTIQNIIDNFLLLSLPSYYIVCLVAGGWLGNVNLINFTYSIILFAGCLIGALLLIHEYNEYNPITSHMCNKSKGHNCSAVLHSKGSRFLNIPWSVLGTSYFLGLLMALLTSNFSQQVVVCSSFLHLASIVFLLYSLYYQRFIIKQWCPLCLYVLLIIVLLFVVSLISHSYMALELLSLDTFISIGGALILSFVLTYLIFLYILQKKTNNFYKQELRHIKFSSPVFSALLSEEEEIPVSTEEFGIMIGKKDAKIQILKVCSPFCGHCANAQIVIDRLMELNDDISLKIIFTSNPNYEGYEKTPIDTFLSLYYEKKDVMKALRDWYSLDNYDLDSFKERYPVSEQRTERNRKNALKMSEFCDIMKIKGTPTIYINGHKLPSIYRIEDLQYVLL